MTRRGGEAVTRIFRQCYNPITFILFFPTLRKEQHHTKRIFVLKKDVVIVFREPVNIFSRLNEIFIKSMHAIMEVGEKEGSGLKRISSANNPNPI